MRLADSLRYAVYRLIARHLPASTSLFAGKMWRRLRTWIAAPLLASHGQDINIEHGADFGTGRLVSLGSRSSIGVDAALYGHVSIGRDVMMGPGVVVNPMQHRTASTRQPMIAQGFEPPSQVVIDDDVWIGLGALILGDVHVGRGAIVAAGAVVTRDVPEYAVVAGNPARVVKDRRSKDAAEPANGVSGGR